MCTMLRAVSDQVHLSRQQLDEKSTLVPHSISTHLSQSQSVHHGQHADRGAGITIGE